MANLNMKSFVSGIVAGSILFSGVSFAAPAAVKLLVNGKEVHSEVPAQIIDGSTMVPARALAEALGARVKWDPVNQTVIVEKPDLRQFGEQEMIQLAVSAKGHYWDVANGHMINSPVPDGAEENGPVQSFTYQGKDYRWMGGELGTKARLIAYLEEVFTPEQAKAFWKQQTDDGNLAEIDGRVAQLNADGGSLLNWSQAKVKLIQDGSDLKSFQCTIPLGDGTAGSEEKLLKVRLVEGTVWRIDEPVLIIR